MVSVLQFKVKGLSLQKLTKAQWRLLWLQTHINTSYRLQMIYLDYCKRIWAFHEWYHRWGPGGFMKGRQAQETIRRTLHIVEHVIQKASNLLEYQRLWSQMEQPQRRSIQSLVGDRNIANDLLELTTPSLIYIRDVVQMSTTIQMRRRAPASAMDGLW